MSAREFSELVGQTFTRVVQENDKIEFYSGDELLYKIYHDQDCCESVYIEDVNGDLSDLENTPILSAEENYQAGEKDPGLYDDSSTWSFYHIRTIKGTVTIRFYGTSNGYYSETAELYCYRKQERK